MGFKNMKKDAQYFIADAIEDALLIRKEQGLLEVPGDLYWEIEKIRKSLHKKWNLVWGPCLTDEKPPFK